MSIFHRIQQTIQQRIYKFIATDRLIERIQNKRSASNTVITALKERLAHQDGTLAAVDLVK